MANYEKKKTWFDINKNIWRNILQMIGVIIIVTLHMVMFFKVTPNMMKIDPAKKHNRMTVAFFGQLITNLLLTCLILLGIWNINSAKTKLRIKTSNNFKWLFLACFGFFFISDGLIIGEMIVSPGAPTKKWIYLVNTVTDFVGFLIFYYIVWKSSAPLERSLHINRNYELVPDGNGGYIIKRREGFTTNVIS